MMQIQRTAFATPDAQANFGLFAAVENLNNIINTNMLNTPVVVNNNGSASYTVADNTNFVVFTGTQQATLTINLPAVTGGHAIDGQAVTIYSDAAAGSGLTVASAGGTVYGAPATFAAKSIQCYRYIASITSWVRYA
jgi:hypothetical protein